MPNILLGNHTVSLEDFAKVVYGKEQVDLDTAVVEKIKAGNAKGAAQRKLISLSPIEYTGDFLSESNTRAFITGKLIALLQGQSHITLEVMTTLALMLNKNILPQIPASGNDRLALQALAFAITGQGLYSKDGSLSSISDAYTEFAHTAASFSEREFATFTQSCSATSALMALAAFGAKTLSGSADAIAAITCEASQAFTEPFQTPHTDSARPLKGIVKSANHLRQLLEGSKEVNSRTTVKTVDPEALRCIPQHHGPVVNSIAHITIDAKVELNATEDGPFDGSSKSGGAFHPQPAQAGLMTILYDLSVLANASFARIRHMNDAFQTTTASTETLLEKTAYISKQCDQFAGPISALTESSLTFPVAVLSVVDAALEVLASELHLGLTILSEREQRVIRQQIEKLEAKEKAAAARAAATGKDGAAGASGAADGKKKEKEKEKKKITGLNLGKGTALYRNYVLGKSGEEESEASTDLPSVAEIAKRIHAYDAGYSNWVENQLLAASNQIRKPKIAKGTRDFMPYQMAIRQKAFNIITDVFKRHGAVTIDTPVFELKETLTGKYGEDSKLIYDLADQGGEILSLRYDLTVPFARFCATYGIGTIKRYHISRVYRRDNPATNRGRFREFYQCDFDIAGHYGLMLPDSEVLKILTEILDELEIGRYEVKLNHRKLLDGILEVAGVPATKFRTICSSIDKLDKEPWSVVKTEMVEEKGISADVADRIGKYVCLKDTPMKLLTLLTTSEEYKSLNENSSAKTALDEFKVLFQYLSALGAVDKIMFDLSLARGLDYYTGVIYEAVFTESNLTGSIAGGGRYDNLVGMFNPSGRQVPAVGVSIGIERIFTIMEDKFKQTDVRTTETQVLVASAGSNMAEERMRLCAELWGKKVKAEMLYSVNPKMQEQIEYAIEQKIPFMVTIGENEVRDGVVQLKEVASKKQDTIARSVLAEEIFKRLQTLE
eukprot:TRINITY_DN4402_c0_g1_i1.p1 TRINITY_DN4402_c0_g1~~TRINITY_DN4402_c0_g1_i1.p1  ORF type:complete len:954 (-),score=238.26 TRINITY_DN4402_c0_g1_i1:209-3070(-)